MVDLGANGEFLEKEILYYQYLSWMLWQEKNLNSLINCIQYWLFLTRFGKKYHSSAGILILQLYA